MVSNQSCLSLGDGWKTNKHHVHKASIDTVHASSRSESHSFYITNFPDYIIHSDIWRACSWLGKVCDNLCEVWFGYYKLFASTHRIQKKATSPYMEPPKVVKKRENIPVSYANVVQGGNSEFSSFIKDEIAIVLESRNFVIDNKKLACLAKARDFNTLPNLGMLYHDEGFDV
ncbi:unnamed protein product [Lactuca saligna]|uniref:Uncharacterized protein n=1 Tax=Lactuca saligna TaxID=75948 RepID=A0AA35VZ39_LACSI|nr:unnamed protein product [Lactuca saligna]